MVHSSQNFLFLGLGKEAYGSRVLYVAKLQISTGTPLWYKPYLRVGDDYANEYHLGQAGAEDSDGNLVWFITDAGAIWLYKL